MVVGPAGSGKTTILMQAALALSAGVTPIYYLRNPVKDLVAVIKNLELINENGFALFVDRMSIYSKQLADYLKSRTSPKWVVVGTDTLSVWEKRVASHLARFCRDTFEVNKINESDAKAILDKVEQFGRWTRLGRLSAAGRIAEFMVKAERQLLIGLLETTRGIGYEKIIENDFASIDSNEEKGLFLFGWVGDAASFDTQSGTAVKSLRRYGNRNKH